MQSKVSPIKQKRAKTIPFGLLYEDSYPTNAIDLNRVNKLTSLPWEKLIYGGLIEICIQSKTLWVSILDMIFYLNKSESSLSWSEIPPPPSRYEIQSKPYNRNRAVFSEGFLHLTIKFGGLSFGEGEGGEPLSEGYVSAWYKGL